MSGLSAKQEWKGQDCRTETRQSRFYRGCGS
jgi:hypothetical protein